MWRHGNYKKNPCKIIEIIFAYTHDAATKQVLQKVIESIPFQSDCSMMHYCILISIKVMQLRGINTYDNGNYSNAATKCGEVCSNLKSI